MMSLLRAFGRILLFLGLFLAIFFAGTLLTGPLITPDGPPLLLYSLVTSVAAVLAGAIMIRRVDRRPVGALGLAVTSFTPREVVIGLAIGAGALAFAVALMLVAGGLAYLPQEGTLGEWLATTATGFGILAVAAFAEEALFRGYPFQVLVQATGAVVATLTTSVLFALAHLWNPNIDGFALLNIFLAGVLLAIAYLRTRSLWFATAVHLGWNWAMALLFDLPVSGLEMEQFDAPLYQPVVGDPRWFTGGEFGPEGGLVGALAFVVALLAVARLPGIGIAPRMRALRPIGLHDGQEEVAHG